jgi:predicted DsbA family dithiol-disulfide isomerase
LCDVVSGWVGSVGWWQFLVGKKSAPKFGGADRVAGMNAHLEKVAKEAGLAIDLAKIPRIPNTLNAHRMIHWAGLEGKQTAMVSALFKAYWRAGRDIGDVATLAVIAGEIGLDSAAMARLLASDADVQMIMDRDTHARSRGVNAVPTFVIADQYVVSGAQQPQMWGQVIEELTAKAAIGQ